MCLCHKEVISKRSPQHPSPIRTHGAAAGVQTLQTAMAPRPAVPLREIVYTLSPYNQQIVLQGVQKLPGKIGKFFANVSVVGVIQA